MMQKNRLAGYLVEQISMEQYLDGDVTISLEGLFGIGGKSDPKLKQALANNNRTIGNSSWVKARLSPRAVSSERLIESVSYNGKTYTDPVQVLKKSGALFASFLTNYRKRLAGYHEDIMDIMQWGGELLEQGQDPNVVGQRMVEEFGKHPLPIDNAQRYTEFFGSLVWNPGSGFSKDAQAVASVDKLPPLTANQILSATKVINDQTTWISKFQSNLFLPGTNTSQDHVMQQLGRSSSRSEIADLAGNTRTPRQQYDQMQKGIKYWLEMHQVVLQWLNTQLNTSTSMESVDDGNFMEEHAGMVAYLNGEQETLSTEGLWDGIKKLFDAKAPDPRLKEKDGKSVYDFSWVPTFRKEIEKTYANLDWVNRHYHPRDVRAPKLALELSYKHRLPQTPMEVLKNARDVAMGHYKEKMPALKAYATAIDKLDGELSALHKKLGDDRKTAMELVNRAKAITRPFRKGSSGPQWLGGLTTVVVPGRRNYEMVGVTPAKGYHVNGTTLPSLAPEQIVEAAKAMLEAVDTLAKIDYPHAGSGCDTEAWSELYDKEEDLMGEAYEFMYFQAAPEEQANFVSLYLSEWSDLLYKVARWLHTQITEEEVSLESLERSPMTTLVRRKLPNKHQISLESASPRLAQYFDDKPKAARSDERAALFGTVDSNWRATLEEMLDCAVFNPVVDDWDEAAQAQEELVKRTATALVFCVTPKQTGFYSFVEITAAAIRTPERIYVCLLDDDEGAVWEAKQKASVDATKTFLKNECGITVYDSLNALAEAINEDVEPISQDGTAGESSADPTYPS